MKRCRHQSILVNCTLAAVVFSLLLWPGIALASVMDEWSEGLGQSPNAVHSFLFEATFLNIDVAIVEFLLDAESAKLVSAITAEGEVNDLRTQQVGEVLLAAETIAFSMHLQRDLSCSRLNKAMGLNLERARESGLISDSEHDLVGERLKTLLMHDEERGVLEGDRLMYRVQPEGVRVVLLGVDGKLLVDSQEQGTAWVRGIKGVFLGPTSKLRENLVQAVWDSE